MELEKAAKHQDESDRKRRMSVRRGYEKPRWVREASVLSSRPRSLRFPNLGWYQIPPKGAGTVPDVPIDTKDNKPLLVALSRKQI